MERPEASVACVRDKSMEDIVAAVTKEPSIMERFSPVVDGKTYFSNYESRAKAGKFIQKVELSQAIQTN